MAEATGARTLALPDEPPEAILGLARAFPGTELVILAKDNDGLWPRIASSDPTGIRCFQPVSLAGGEGGMAALRNVLVFRITCP
jgi:hypothetical protein